MFKVFMPIMAAMRRAMKFRELLQPASERTPQIRHYKHKGQAKARTPNDGRWHMKHHRGRS